jgi:hypothetical protein
MEARMNPPANLHFNGISGRSSSHWLIVPATVAAAVALVWFASLPADPAQAANTVLTVAPESQWVGDASVPSASAVRFQGDAEAAPGDAPTF